MPEIVKYRQDEGIIYVEGSGEITYENVKSTIEQGIKYNHQYNAKNVLSNHINVESVPEEVDVFNLGSELAQKLRGFNIALIHRQKFEEFYSLFANAANARGGNVKLFNNEDTALKWLKSIQEKI